jgi:integrase
VPLDEARALLARAGTATTPGALEAVRRAVARVCSGEVARRPEAAPPPTTYGDVAHRWISGELTKEFPDHVRPRVRIDSDRAYHERYITRVIGDVPITELELEDLDRVLKNLPSALAQGTRRQIAKSMARVVSLSVYPLRLLRANWIPRNWLPSKPDPKAKAWLYPSEDAQMLASPEIPLCWRILYGFLDREGPRVSEAAALDWSDLDLERGAITLDENKTDDPRAWALSPGVALALAAWRHLRAREGAPVGPSDHVFCHERGGRITRAQAEKFRAYLQRAGVDRPQLYEHGPARLRCRIHDLRGTFVTIALANGRTESWVQDRTGHRSSEMIALYKRAARQASELGLGPLHPLVEAIPELRPGGGLGAGLGAAEKGATTPDPANGGNQSGKSRTTRRVRILPRGAAVQPKLDSSAMTFAPQGP